MSAGCEEFRSVLERALRGRPDRPLRLGWHRHLGGCRDCRALFEAEEALERLLETLPEPRLPVGLRRRVLERLAEVELERRDARVDELLGRLPPVHVPTGLVARVAASVRASVREPDAGSPPGEGTTREEPGGAPGGGRFPRWGWTGIAAGILALAALLRFAPGPGDRAGGVGGLGLGIEQEPDESDLLASLDVLERWEVLMEDDVDLLLSDLDPVDESLLETEVEERAAAPVGGDTPLGGRR